MDTNFNYQENDNDINMNLLQNLGNLNNVPSTGLNDATFNNNDYPQYCYEGSHPNFQEREVIAKQWISAINPDEEVVVEPGDTKDKRGNYKCGRCGQPKKGHNCPNQPRPKNQNLQTSEGCCQAELDQEMTMRSLPGEGKAQGFPTSYGLKSWYSTKYPSIPFPVNAISALQALTNIQGLAPAAGTGGAGSSSNIGESLGGNQAQLLNEIPQLQQMQLLTQLKTNHDNIGEGL